MVRTQSHPHPLSAIDAKRIAANTLVVVVHVLAFALLLLPTRWEPPVEKAVRETDFDWIEVKPKVEPVVPPPPVVEQIVRREEVSRDPPQRVVIDAPPVSTEAVFDTGELPADPPGEIGPPVTTFETGPQLADLAYVANPAPRYPGQAIRAGHEGRVLLRVFVDAQGRPVEVTIEESSGHRELDRAAREKVLADWRFQPAMRAGVPVPAIGLVPIDFRLP